MSKIKQLKKIINDLQRYKFTLEPFSKASINTHNEILRFKKLYPVDPISYDILEILVVSYINLGASYEDIIEIFDALEETDKFLYNEANVKTIYDKIKV